jgi:iron complex transport system ATP-binding protein
MTSPTVRAAVARLAGATVRRAGQTILGPLDLAIGAGERWVVIGPNGSGKTTLLEVLSTYLWPSNGEVEILGERIGATDSRELRRRIGYAGAGLEPAIDPDLPVLDVVMTARHGALAPWWHVYDRADEARAQGLLERFGMGAFARRPFALLSTGERRRVQLARALMPDPDLLLLDEPTAGLDLGAREILLADLAALACEPRPAGILVVLHHVEEIPASFDQALVLRAGRAVASGPIAEAVASGPLSEAFGLPIRVERRGGRFSARLAGQPGGRG